MSVILAAVASPAVQAVTDGLLTAAPPSFDGHGWLVVINLAGQTTCFLIAIVVLRLLWSDSRRYRSKERGSGWTPDRMWRRIGMLYASGVAIRSGGAAWVLWRWNPLDPKATAAALFTQRMLDPIALMCAIIGLGLFVLTLPGMLEHAAPLAPAHQDVAGAADAVADRRLRHAQLHRGRRRGVHPMMLRAAAPTAALVPIGAAMPRSTRWGL